MAEMFELKIIEPDGMFYEGQASFLEFASVMGEMGVYANHIPLTTILAPGVVKIHNDGQVKKAAVMGGFIEIQKDRIMRLVALVNSLTRKKSEKYVGKTVEILCEDYDEEKKLYLGRDEFGRMGYFESETPLIGKFISLKVTNANGISLYGDVVAVED